MINTTASLGSGFTGALVGSMILPVPVLGSFLGGFIGGYLSLSTANILMKKFNNKEYKMIVKQLEEMMNKVGY